MDVIFNVILQVTLIQCYHNVYVTPMIAKLRNNNRINEHSTKHRESEVITERANKGLILSYETFSVFSHVYFWT